MNFTPYTLVVNVVSVFLRIKVILLLFGC